MANIKELYPKEYIQVSDLDDGDWELTIAAVDIVVMKDKYKNQDVQKLVLAFEEVPQKLPLTPTNAGRIATILGNETDDYIGKKIIIGIEDEPKAQGGKAVRIKAPLRVIKPAPRVQQPARPPQQRSGMPPRRPAPTSAQEAADAAIDEAGGDPNVPF